MQGLSSYAPGAQDPRNPALANNRMSDQDNAGLDQMLRNIDSGASAPSDLSQARREVPSQGQGQNPWLQWLMQYLSSKQQGGQQGMPPQGQPR